MLKNKKLYNRIFYFIIYLIIGSILVYIYSQNKSQSEYVGKLEIQKQLLSERNSFLNKQEEVRNLIIGKRFALNDDNFQLINHVDYHHSKNKIVIVISKIDCTPCHEDVLNAFISRFLNGNVNVYLAAMIPSRNIQIPKQVMKKYLDKIPVFVDLQLRLMSEYKIEDINTTVLLINDKNQIIYCFNYNSQNNLELERNLPIISRLLNIL